MNLALFYDTETTGLPLFGEPSEDPRQPHIVQLAAALVDLDTRDTIASLDLVVRPDGWVIPDEVSAVHGITTEHAAAVGVPESLALSLFFELWAGRPRIGHNEQFDARIIRIAQHRAGELEPDLDAWKAGRTECTAKMATPIVKCSPTPKMIAAGRNHYKTANLSEAVLFFTGKPLENAHSAMADVKGCMDVYFAIQDMRNGTPGALVDAEQSR
ncbi:3'-5' exonuclease [Bordetella bronchiseptica]|uniref:Exonuclease n=1 Tax=Bordetella bronchiseptica 00-P-2796 TaxID=1331199 RepID=A0ABR4RKC7_BORBO|nr:3'-5' exonuclease [Bordetella bronchiseptica]KCV35744.1 exonuclease [Bordetella bronchiseptica 00-P-2796]KDC15271.1 exonuclease [Bordetella bronchiseptica F-1]KDC29269.1 exonuclease [Bordetella bronchiseptica F2]